MAFLSHDPNSDAIDGGTPVRGRTGLNGAFDALAGRLDAAFSDDQRNVSRPKLLFATSAADVAIVCLMGIVATLIVDGAQAADLRFAAWNAVIALAATLALRRNWSYSIRALCRPGEQIRKIAFSLVPVFCIAAGAGYLIGHEPFSPAGGLVWIGLAGVSVGGFRFGLARILDTLTEAGRLVRRTVIVGGGPDAEALITALEADKLKELSILGVFDDRLDERSADSVKGFPKLGNFDQLPLFCRGKSVDLIIVTVPLAAEQRLMHILKVLVTLPVDIRISALSSKLRLSSGAYSYIGRVPMFALMDRPLTDWDRVIKNIEDRVLGTLLFLLAAPVMAFVALAVRLDSKGPVLFKQRRFGFNNELIEVWKFRSMYTDMADASAAKLVTKDDPRVTPVGRFIRKTSLDELPQLINVMKGQMSLVGPRPHATEAKASSDLYETVVGGYFARHRMKPGVTGWAQINGWRGETDTHEKIQRRVEADLYYIDNWSLLFDLYIIVATPFALLTGKNAY
jgi:Undecaprenyl-phosphate glucose phosphotransferase